MARRRKRSNKLIRRQDQRDAYSPSLAPLLIRRPRTRLREIEDRRIFRIDPAPARRYTMEPVQLRVARPAAATPRALPSRLRFRGHKGVIVCMRRKERREVLFAKGKGGGRVSKIRRRNRDSEISCRR